VETATTAAGAHSETARRVAGWAALVAAALVLSSHVAIVVSEPGLGQAWPTRAASAISLLAFVGIPIAVGVALLGADRRWHQLGAGAGVAFGLPSLAGTPATLWNAAELLEMGWWGMLFPGFSVALAVLGAAALVSILTDPVLARTWPPRWGPVGRLGGAAVVAVALLAVAGSWHAFVGVTLSGAGALPALRSAVFTATALIGVGVLVGVAVLVVSMRPWTVATGALGALAAWEGLGLVANVLARRELDEAHFPAEGVWWQRGGEVLEIVGVVAVLVIAVVLARRVVRDPRSETAR
jgi:hypothetical protein